MKKRTIIFLAGALCAVSFTAGAVTSDVVQDIKAQLRPDFTIKIDGAEKTFKNVDGETVYPILYDGTTYLPIRAIGEMMGKTVYWYEADKIIALKEEKTTVTDADVIITDGAAPIQATQEPASYSSPTAKTPVAIDTSSFVGEDKAKEIALEKAGITADAVIFDRVELDEDGGIWHYEIEFRKDLTEYDADIKATDGTILSWEVDRD